MSNMLLISTSEGNFIDYGSTANQPKPKSATDQNADYKNGGRFTALRAQTPVHAALETPNRPSRKEGSL